MTELGRFEERRFVDGHRRENRVFEDVAGCTLGPEQTFDLGAQGVIAAARFRQVAVAFGGRLELDRPSEDSLRIQHRIAHRVAPVAVSHLIHATFGRM